MSARYDLATDPAILADLLATRRATSYLTRRVNELRDEDLLAPSRLPGWSRAHVIAHVGYNARALCRLVTWAVTEVETPMYPSHTYRDREIEFGATLQPHALRHLFDHAAVSLNVEWRDTPDEAWHRLVRTATGREVELTETLWMRLRELWLHAIDLDNGARWEDIPAAIVQRLLLDISGTWRARGLDTEFELVDEAGESVASTVGGGGSAGGGGLAAGGGGSAAGGDGLAAGGGVSSIRIAGPRPLLLAWAAGRADERDLKGLSASRDGLVLAEVPAAPRWI